MSRSGLTNTYITSSAATIRPILCAYMDFSGSAVRLCNALNNTTITDDFGGGTYTAVGYMGALSTVTETTEVASKNVDLTLTGIPSQYLSLALADQYRGRAVCIYLLLYNEAFTAYEQVTLFRGRMNTMTISETGESSVIKLSCESRLVELERPRERRYTQEEQTRRFPGDIGLQYLASSVNKDIYWGNSVPGTNVGASVTGVDGGSRSGGYKGTGMS